MLPFHQHPPSSSYLCSSSQRAKPWLSMPQAWSSPQIPGGGVGLSCSSSPPAPVQARLPCSGECQGQGLQHTAGLLLVTKPRTSPGAACELYF